MVLRPKLINFPQSDTTAGNDPNDPEKWNEYLAVSFGSFWENNPFECQDKRHQEKSTLEGLKMSLVRCYCKKKKSCLLLEWSVGPLVSKQE